MKNMKCLQSGTKMYPEVKEKSTSTTKVICQDSKRKQSLIHNELRKDFKHDCNSQMSWNDSMLSKEDNEAIWLRRQEAMAKRERVKKYSYSHRERTNTHMLDESMHVKETGRSSFVGTEANSEANKGERVMILKPNVPSNLSTWKVHGLPHVRLRNLRKQDTLDGLNSPFFFPRRSFYRVQQSPAVDEGSIPNSPVFPTNMAATESAKAKARSMSTPRQRVGFFDSCFDYSVPYKGGLSFWSAYIGEPFRIDKKSCLPMNRLC